jgi:PAS domain S-box-containing protein
MCPEPYEEKLPQSFFDALYSGLHEPADAPSLGTDDPDHQRLNRLVEHWPAALFCLDTRLVCRLANHEARAWTAHRWPAVNGHRECHADDVLIGACPGSSSEVALRVPPVTLSDLLDGTIVEALLPYLSAALRGMDMGFEDTFTHPQLGPRLVAVRVQPDTVAGEVHGVFLHLQDKTDERHADLLAQAQQSFNDTTPATDHDAHLRMLVEGLRDAAIFFIDAQGHVSDWPPSAERLFGVQAADMLGQSIQRFSPNDVQDAADPMLLGMERAALLGQSETPGWQVRADGSRFWANTLLTVLHDEATGEACGYACLMRDTTEVKRLVDLLQELNQALETRVEERTRQLQDINQDLEAFSYSVSHDLRAPLRHIASFVELLREDLGPTAPADALRHLATIDDSAQHMGQLIEGLLAFSRLGRAPLERREVAMAALLQSSLNRVQHDPALQRPPEAVQWTLPTDLPPAWGDSLLLSQVWDNLLANALKYSRRREVAQIAVGWQVERRDGVPDQTVYWVRDNGVGFNPQRADRLFGVFQRLHRASEFEGTGIGLALCRRIVERHGGRIWAESRVGEGSTFYFALPAPPPAAEA